ncbi:hypothetical protein BGX34_002003 [Mortierella sp. NVP85]|nr:hypothetical protein BGX34_002003 [Mortierella sp. NVP85]
MVLQRMRMHTRPYSLPSFQQALPDLREVIEKGRTQCGVPGMGVAVLHKGELVFAEGFGKRNAQEPFTSETLAPIGSLTKAFTATAIGELVAEGKMDWDKTPVNKFLPDFELKSPILTSQLTLVDLLSHRTGLRTDIDVSWYKSTASRRNLIKRLKHVEMNPKLGSRTVYNNIMYAVAGEAAAEVEGIPYEKVVETKVLAPLGLTNTGFSPMEMKKQANYAMPLSAASWNDAQNGVFAMGSLDEIYMVRAPAGDMYSNVLDMARWGKAVMDHGRLDGKQILNEASVQETLRPYTIMDGVEPRSEFGPTVTYGLGWTLGVFKGQTFYTHGGSTSGFMSNIDIFPDADLVIVVLSNTNSSSLINCLPMYIAEKLLDLPTTQDWMSDLAVKGTKAIYDIRETALGWDHLPKRIPDKPAAQELQAYEGTYTHPALGEITVRLEADSLTTTTTTTQKMDALFAKLGPFDSKLEHYHFDSFVVTLNDVDVKLTDLVTFRTANDGSVVGLHTMGEEFKKL